MALSVILHYLKSYSTVNFIKNYELLFHKNLKRLKFSVQYPTFEFPVNYANVKTKNDPTEKFFRRIRKFMQR